MLPACTLAVSAPWPEVVLPAAPRPRQFELSQHNSRARERHHDAHLDEHFKHWRASFESSRDFNQNDASPKITGLGSEPATEQERPTDLIEPAARR